MVMQGASAGQAQLQGMAGLVQQQQQQQALHPGLPAALPGLPVGLAQQR
jgi:hypothetical protein